MSILVSSNFLDHEAWLLSRYIIGEDPGTQAIDLYKNFLERNKIELSPRDIRLLEFAINHPWSISYLDSALAIMEPEAELRRRIYLMFAILETQPQHADAFLPQTHTAWYWASMGITGLSATYRFVIGLILLEML